MARADVPLWGVPAFVALIAAGGLAAVGADAPADRPRPLLDARDRAVEYHGPGREAPPPAELREILIALFGPEDEDHPEWGEIRRGAVLALEEANAAGGCEGLPFRLVSTWSDNPWGSGASDLARLVYREGVWAILGGVDGATTHLAEQIAVKARLSLVSPGGTDPSVHFTNVPWVFTLPATDDRMAPVLADAVMRGRGGGPWAVVTTSDRDAHMAWRIARREFVRCRMPDPALHLVLPPEDPSYAHVAAMVAGHGARCVLLLGGARDAARMVKALRAAGYDGGIVGGAPLGRRPFVQEAGEYAEGIVFPLLFDGDAPHAAAFVEAYAARHGAPPDYLAACAYDAMHLLVHATRRAGPNRALIRDALAQCAPWSGATGAVTWDLTGRNEGLVTLGVWRNGRPRRWSPEPESTAQRCVQEPPRE